MSSHSDLATTIIERARALGLEPEFFALNFAGQNLGFVVRGRRP